jgi:molybdopterin-guanine dinucleotide biosynthesis protein A
LRALPPHRPRVRTSRGWWSHAKRSATAYRSTHDSLPEPLCAIYEPAARAAIETYVAAGRHCPRKFLLSSDANLIEQPDPRALDNINTVEEHHAAARALGD